MTVMAHAPLAGEVYNVASGEGVTITHLVAHVTAVLGLSPRVSYTGEIRPGDALHWVGDMRRLRALGFVPAVPLRRGSAGWPTGSPSSTPGSRRERGLQGAALRHLSRGPPHPAEGRASLEALRTRRALGPDAPRLPPGRPLGRGRRPRLRVRQPRLVAAADRLRQRRRRGREPRPDRAGRRLGVQNLQHGDVLEFLRDRTAQYDLLIARDLFEHLTKEDTLEALTLCREALRPGGALLLQVPNGESPLAGRIIYGDFTHETAFTQSSIAQVLRAAGFESVSCHPVRPVVYGISRGSARSPGGSSRPRSSPPSWRRSGRCVRS